MDSNTACTGREHHHDLLALPAGSRPPTSVNVERVWMWREHKAIKQQTVRNADRVLPIL
jgi:hypothetical protein